MSILRSSRREFIKVAGAGAAGLAFAGPASSQTRIIGANARVRVGIVGFSDRSRDALIPAFKKHRVDWTTPDEPTVWLGVRYGGVT